MEQQKSNSQLLEIDYVTCNRKKFEEAYHILVESEKNRLFTVVHTALHLTEIQGTAEEIAIHKAQEAYKACLKPVIVDDVSVHFPCLQGFPGPYIKPLLEAIGDEALYRLISHYDDRSFEVVCTIAFYTGIGPVKLFDGRVFGKIVAPEGNVTLHGHATWNRIAQIDGCSSTCASMSLEEFAKVSHRNIALQQLKRYFHEHYLAGEASE